VFGDWSLNFAHRLLLEHAVRMMDQPDSWQIALTYAAVSPNEALRSELCTTILTHVDPSSDAIALKLYEAATNLQMTQVASSICAVRGQQCAARRQFGLALAWFTRGEHVMGLRSLGITLMSYITAEDAPENALTVLGAALKSHHYSAAVTLAPELQFVFHFVSSGPFFRCLHP
jgi:Nup85 Nucleoporin